MKLFSVNSANFLGRIIDAHTHIGKWADAGVYKDNGLNELDTFFRQPLADGDVVEKMIVSNLDCIENNGMLDELAGNRKMLEIAKKDSRVCPMAVCQPKTGDVKNIEKLFNENPNSFFGLKFHPKMHDIAADDVKFEPYMKFAQKRKLPCLFHSQVNVQWNPDGTGQVVTDIAKWDKSDPRLIYNLAKKYPDVPVILGHMGAGGAPAHKVAIETLAESFKNNDAKLYCDISWVDFRGDWSIPDSHPNIISIIEKCKEANTLDRILFGSDVPVGTYGLNEATTKGTTPQLAYKTTIENVKNTIRKNFSDAEEIIDRIFYKNANELFFGNKPEIPGQILPAKPKSRLPKSALGLAVGIGGVLLAFAGYLCFGKNTNTATKPDNA